MEIDRATGIVSVQAQVTGLAGEHIDLYARSGPLAGASAKTAWKMLARDIPTEGSSRVEILHQMGDLQAATSGFFILGRSDIDADFNGIPDSRQGLLDQFDLPEQQRAAWGMAGLEDGYETAYSAEVSIMDFGAAGDGVQDDTAALRAALKAVPQPGVVTLPAGTFRITGRIYLDDYIVLRGAGSSKTRLRFEGTGTTARCIGVTRWSNEQVHPFKALTAAASFGGKVLQVGNLSGLAVGDVLEVEQDNEPTWGLNDGWQEALPGQLLRVETLDEAHGRILLDRPLRYTFSTLRNARVRKLEVLEGAGIEDLYIERVDAVEGDTIEMKYAVNCWIHRVESVRTYSSHVWMDSCMNIDIRESYFHEAHAYGGGGQGYGVTCGRHTSDTLVEDNVFRHLRHALIVGSGANGNVYGYNYSTERVPDPDSGTLQPDISVHGNFVFMNLFEGNVVEDADLPDYYHPAGPGNTLFRNRILNTGGAVDIGSDRQNVVGNHLPHGYIRIRSGVEETICHGNRLGQNLQWEQDTSQELSSSFYRAVRPGFFKACPTPPAWPPIGPHGTEQNQAIPAEIRYLDGQPVPQG